MNEVKWDEGNPITWNCVATIRQNIQIIFLLSIKVYVLLIYIIRPVYETDIAMELETVN